MSFGDQRKPLVRLTPMPRSETVKLARTGGPARKAPIPRTRVVNLPAGSLAPVTELRKRPRAHAASGAPKPLPGFPAAVRKFIVKRDGRCVLAAWQTMPGWPGLKVPPCGGGLECHHRDNVGMGGTSTGRVHHPANGLLVCFMHHQVWAHANPARAKELGIIVADGFDFLQEPMSFDGGFTWYVLGEDGTYDQVPPPGGGDAA